MLKDGGFAAEDITITPYGETATLVARYPGTDPAAKPIVIGGHMDVVSAFREDWERDPFTAVIEQGFVFGRGSSDNKFGISSMVTTLLWLKQEGFRPRRDIILALTGDEETSQSTTAVLAQQFKHAEMYLNSDGGGALLDDEGRPVFYGLQAAEKTYMDFEVAFTNPGGHSSRPSSHNAIYDLARAISRVAAFRFPARNSELTMAYFRAAGPLTPGEVGAAMLRYAADPSDREAYELLASQPEHVGQLGTTCVATMAKAGHAPNALPQHAMVNINCRVFPGESIEEIQATLERVIDDPTASVKVVEKPRPVPSDASPLRDDVMKARAQGHRPARAGTADRAVDVRRRDRRPVFPQCRRAELRSRRDLHECEGQLCPRPERARAARNVRRRADPVAQPVARPLALDGRGLALMLAVQQVQAC